MAQLAHAPWGLVDKTALNQLVEAPCSKARRGKQLLDPVLQVWRIRRPVDVHARMDGRVKGVTSVRVQMRARWDTRRYQAQTSTVSLDKRQERTPL